MTSPSRTHFKLESAMCRSIPEMARIILKDHIAYESLTPEIRKRFVDQYLNSLDPTKTKLLFADAEAIRDKLNDIFQKIEKGDCSAIVDIYETVLARLKDNEGFVKKFLAPGYRLDKDVSMQTDARKIEYAKTKEEKKERLKKNVHFQVATYLDTGATLKEAKQNTMHRYELATKHFLNDESIDMLDLFLDSFSSSLDPHTTYLSPGELEDFHIMMQLSLEGIGAVLTSQDGYTTVEEIVTGGAADRADVLKVKDKIIAVGNGDAEATPVVDMELQDVVRLIRGPKGSTAKLVILRKEDGVNKRVDVSIVRDKIDVKDEAVSMRVEERNRGGKNLKIGIIDLPSFYGPGAMEESGRSCYEDVKQLMEQARNEKLDGLVIDLSKNGGGLLDEAVKLTGLFIKKGPVVETSGHRSLFGPDIMFDPDPSIQYSGPLVILSSRLSASAAEIFAGALKSYQRAVIVGSDHTFGKGSVQVVKPFAEGVLGARLGAYKVTIDMFFIPDGNSTQQQGVKSDIVIPSILNVDEIGEESLDYSLPPGKTDPFIGNEANADTAPERWEPVTSGQIRTLSDLSKKRVAESKVFQEISKDLEKMKKGNGTVRLSELMEKAGEKKSAEDDKIPEKEAGKKKSPQIDEAVEIMVDLIGLSAQNARLPM